MAKKIYKYELEGWKPLGSRKCLCPYCGFRVATAFAAREKHKLACTGWRPFKCCDPDCPGYPWRASERPHIGCKP